MSKRKNLPLSALLDYEQVVTVLHTAGLRDLDRGWVRNQADRGFIPFVVVARRRRFREDLIRQMIQDWSDAAA
jgi:hypothetical protein